MSKGSQELIRAAREAWEVQKASWERKGEQVPDRPSFSAGYIDGYLAGYADADDDCPWR